MPAFLLSPLIRWAIIAGLFALALGYGYVQHVGKVAAEKGEKAALERADLSEQDAKRWHDASDLRDGSISQLRDALNIQSDLVEQSRAKQSDLRKALDSARLANDRLQQDADQLERDLQLEAQKSPGDIREVGPIVARRAQQLFE